MAHGMMEKRPKINERNKTTKALHKLLSTQRKNCNVRKCIENKMMMRCEDEAYCTEYTRGTGINISGEHFVVKLARKEGGGGLPQGS